MHTITLTTQELDIVMTGLQLGVAWRYADPVIKKILLQVNQPQMPLHLNGGVQGVANGSERTTTD